MNITMVKDITPQQAWEMMSDQSNIFMVDVRTQPEWTFVGRPDLSSIGKELILISWQIYPTMELNNLFLEQLSKVVSKDKEIIFICRTGGRSHSAATYAQNAGFASCYNLACGFEGDIDTKGHRGMLNGWKASNLPWRQN
jgi:rhodanese-related sulfurtransferase